MYRMMTQDMEVTHQQELTEAVPPSSLQITPLSPED